MARYKEYDYSQGKFIPIHFDRQILPGTFEYSFHYLIDDEIDLSLFDIRYRNDEMGAPAYDPAILIKIILYAYTISPVKFASMTSGASVFAGQREMHMK
jgi:transposase